MSRVVLLVVLPVLALSLSTCTAFRSAPVGPAAVAAPAVIATHVGVATYYGRAFHGRTTASGVPFDMHDLVAAHPTLPFGTIVRVTNLHNGRAVQVRIVDRGPARGPRSTGVIIDLSQAAAVELDFIRRGRARIRLDVLEHANADGGHGS